jgi:hypothetical protein
MMTGTSILESCIILAIRDMRQSASTCVQSVIDLIEGAHQAGYINKAKRSRLIDSAIEAGKR